MAYLAACAADGRTPDPVRTAGMDPDALYRAAERHLLTGITAMALESAGVRTPAFTQGRGKAIRKVAALDVERAAVLGKLEEAGIWYLPLKGAVLKTLYPALGMRQMSDNDILIDAERADDAARVMESLGFAHSHGGQVHDVWFKPPVCSFELHRTLFAPQRNPLLYDYYRDVKSRLIPMEGKRFGFRFTDEDFYVYMIAHEYKHYTGGGTGLRSLVDTYVYCRRKADALDWAYIGQEIEKLGITDFEAQNRSLALHLFGGEPLTVQDREMLDYILTSGTYGTTEQRVANGVKRCGGGLRGKLRYVLRRLFPSMQTLLTVYPFFARHRYLIPFLPIYRFILRRSRIRAELKALTEKGKQNTAV